MLSMVLVDVVATVGPYLSGPQRYHAFIGLEIMLTVLPLSNKFIAIYR